MDFKKFLPHLYAVLILFAVSAIFFSPNFFGNKALPQSDNDKARAIQTEIQEYIKKDGEAPLWTNSLFGGMPSFQVYTTPHGNLSKPFYKALFLWRSYSDVWASMFVAMFCMYLLLSVLRVDWRVALFGAFAFGITSYNVDILEAGHSTKMAALAIAPAMLAGTVLLFRQKWLAGLAVLALFTSLQIYANHFQITYYTLIIMGVYGLGQLIESVRQNNLVDWGKAAVFSIIAILIGFSCNLSRVWPTLEYSRETIRGESELSSKEDKGNGLTKEYLFDWSCGIEESLTLLVPHAAGGGSSESFENTTTFKKNRPDGMSPAEWEQQVGGLMYTGEQPFVGTAIYYGIVAVLLFFMGFFLLEGNVKWWLFISTLVMISFAWGKHFFLNFIWYDYLPMFNKFRAVTMAFGLGQLTLAVLAALGLQKLTDNTISFDKKKKALMYSAGITAALCVMAIMFANTVGPYDDRLGNSGNLLNVLQQDRSSLLYNDVYRSLGFLAVAAALIWFYLRGALKAGLLVLAVAALALTDHWLVARRTLNDTKYYPKRAATAAPQPSDADKQIMADPDPHFRVLDLNGGGIATNYKPSYFHENIGGYHAAKLQRFQEVVDTFLSGSNLANSLHILGMMNVKYLITQNNGVMKNPETCGNVWFVKGYELAANGDAELAALRNLNVHDTAVVQQKYAASLSGFTIQPDSTASIKLVSYHPDKMVYEYSAKTDQLAVFSEMYYPPAKGWNCYLNDQKTDGFAKANYLLRAMKLPAGQHQKLEMRFEPRSYVLGEKVSFAASFITLLLCFGGLYFWFRSGAGVESPVHLSEVEDAPVKEKTSRPAPKKKKK
ncbi:MAG: hypothetical protein R3A50_02295 [Saprospiraceae bacterium]